MIEPKFEVGGALKSYVATLEKGFLGGHWKIEGEGTKGKFTSIFRNGDNEESFTHAKCLNRNDVTF